MFCIFLWKMCVIFFNLTLLIGWGFLAQGGGYHFGTVKKEKDALVYPALPPQIPCTPKLTPKIKTCNTSWHLNKTHWPKRMPPQALSRKRGQNARACVEFGAAATLCEFFDFCQILTPTLLRRSHGCMVSSPRQPPSLFPPRIHKCILRKNTVPICYHVILATWNVSKSQWAKLWKHLENIWPGRFLVLEGCGLGWAYPLCPLASMLVFTLFPFHNWPNIV